MSVKTTRCADFLRILMAWLVLSIPMRASATAPLRISFDTNDVVISDLNAGSEIVYFSVQRSSNGFVPRTERRSERLVDEDGDGEIRVALDRAAPPKFLAVAVDLESGRWGLLTPPGSPATVIPLPVTSLVEGPGRRLDQLEEGQSYIEVLLVRSAQNSGAAGTGALSGGWVLTTGDGTPTDQTPPSDGLVRTSVSDMEPIGMSPPPPLEFETGDILVRVAPDEMEYYVALIER